MAKISGVQAVDRRLRKLAGSEKIALVGQALFAGGERIKATAQRLITENSVSGKDHVPSPPGQPPHNNTGHLKNLIFVYQIGPLHVRVTSEAEYAKIHELGGVINHPGGTPFFIKDGELFFVRKDSPIAARLPKTKPHRIVIPARPYMGPAVRLERKAVIATVRASIDLAVKQG